MDDPLDLPLRDIHLPDPVSWWPPAPGWWILATIIILAVVAAALFYHRNQLRKLTAGYLARVELAKIRDSYQQHRDVTVLARELSILLRRMSISAFPRTETASLTGEAWLKHLDSVMQEKPFTNGNGRILVEAPYRPRVSADEIEPLFDLCESWINAMVSGRKGQTA